MTGFRPKTLSFYGWFLFPEFRDTTTYFDAGSHKTEDSFLFLCRMPASRREDAADQSESFFFLSTTQPDHATRLALASVRLPLQQVTECRDI